VIECQYSYWGEIEQMGSFNILPTSIYFKRKAGVSICVQFGAPALLWHWAWYGALPIAAEGEGVFGVGPINCCKDPARIN
jgi:hypothetical protein